MKRILGFIPLVSVLFFAQAGFCGPTDDKWEDMSFGIDETEMRGVAVSAQDPDLIYAASAKGVYKSSDTGKSWQRLSMIRGTEASLNALAIDFKSTDTIYAGTRSGLYASTDGGAEWKVLFEGMYEQEKNIRHILIDKADPNRIFLGTDKGMIATRNAGQTWSALVGELAKQAVYFIAQEPGNTDILYAAAATGVFKSYNRGLSFERVFSVAAQTEEGASDEVPGETVDQDATYSDKTTNCVAIDARDPRKVYVGTNSGVFASFDSGETWEQLVGAGLLNDHVLSLVSTQDGSLCAATRNGIFRLAPPYHSWNEMYDGILSRDARYLAYGRNKDSLWAATGKGIYHTSLKPAAEAKDETAVSADVAQFLSKFDFEPGIREVHEVAIRYADVHMGKIDKWRRNSKRKALLPSLSVSVSPYLSNTYHWESGSSSNYSDDLLRRGRTPADWSVSASWDLADLVWSTDDTNIDSRARYLVQLRDDVLTGVTRLYYERRRLQIELLTKPAKDINLKVAKQLRIEELTAGLDAYTGGWFSKKLNKFK